MSNLANQLAEGDANVVIDSSPKEVSVNREEAIEAARRDANFLGAIALPMIFAFNFPPIYLAIWEMLCSNAIKHKDFARFALGLPRGFAKTSLMKLYILWVLAFTDRRFILVIGSTSSLAENILADIADMLDEPNIKLLFGDWRIGIERDTHAVKKFSFRGRTVIIAALGSGSSLRGLNIKNARPDIILMDDMQTRENAESPVLSDQLLTWMMGTLMKAKSPTRCQFIFVGNMYPTAGSILRKLKHNSTWTSLIVGALLADGSSIWEELQSREQLMEEFANDIAMGKPEIFIAEVLNDDEASSRSGIDVSAIPMMPTDLYNTPPQGKFIMIDPAGNKLHSDSTEIGLFYVFDGTPALIRLVSGKLDPSQTIREALTLALSYGVSLIGVESVAYQASLLHWFNVISQQHGLTGIEFVEMYPGGYSKNARIKEMLGLLAVGKILLGEDVRSRVVHQIVHWNPLKRDNVDDLLDIIAYAPKMLELYGYLIALEDAVRQQDAGQIRTMEMHEICSF